MDRSMMTNPRRLMGTRVRSYPDLPYYGYLTRPAVEAWGQAWLTRGTMSSHSRSLLTKPIGGPSKWISTWFQSNHQGVCCCVTTVKVAAAPRVAPGTLCSSG